MRECWRCSGRACGLSKRKGAWIMVVRTAGVGRGLGGWTKRCRVTVFHGHCALADWCSTARLQALWARGSRPLPAKREVPCAGGQVAVSSEACTQDVAAHTQRAADLFWSQHCMSPSRFGRVETRVLHVVTMFRHVTVIVIDIVWPGYADVVIGHAGISRVNRVHRSRPYASNPWNALRCRLVVGGRPTRRRCGGSLRSLSLRKLYYTL